MPESPVIQAPPATQAPPAAQSVSSQNITSTPQAAPLTSGQDTLVNLSGPFAASVVWGDGTTTTTASTDEAANISATLTINKDTDTQASGYWLKIDWGDGQIATEVLGQNALNKPFHITGTHVYHQSGSYSINLTISDNNGNQMTATRDIVVRNVIIP